MKVIKGYFGFVAFFSCTLCLGNTATTVCNGSWFSPEVWEDSLLPGQNDTIIIRHFIKNNASISFDSNYVEISETGELCGNANLFVPAGTNITNYGTLGAANFTLDGTVINYGWLECNILIVNNNLTDYGIILVGSYSCFERPDCTPIILRISNDSIASNTTGNKYEWFLNNILLQDTTQRIPLTNSGDYKTRTVDEIGNYSEFSDNYPYAAPVFSSDINSAKKSTLLIYPNPAKNTLFVELRFLFTGEITILNILGEVVIKSKKITNNIQENKYLFDTSALPRGVYFLRATDGINTRVEKFFLE